MGWHVLVVSLIVLTGLLGFFIWAVYQAYLHQKDYEFYVEALARILGTYRQAGESIKSLRWRAEKTMVIQNEDKPHGCRTKRIKRKTKRMGNV